MRHPKAEHPQIPHNAHAGVTPLMRVTLWHQWVERKMAEDEGLYAI
jgi:hypothetical protein